MSAKHALLGLLLNRSAYPYELADRLQVRLGPAWTINSGQLYQTMARMERDGLIERVGNAMDRNDRHVFAITDSGVLEFERWFEQASTDVRLSRRPLLIKITLAGPERLEEVLEQIDAYELECATRLTEISRVREEVPVDGPQIRADHVLLRLNLSGNIIQLEAELAWARHAREMVSWLLARKAIWPSVRKRSKGTSYETPQAAREDLFGRMAAKHLLSEVPGDA